MAKPERDCSLGENVLKKVVGKRNGRRYSLLSYNISGGRGANEERWVRLVNFVQSSLSSAEEIRHRYFCAVRDIQRAEQMLRPSMFAVIVAMTDDGTIAAACWLGRNLVRVGGVGVNPALLATNVVEPAIVTAPDHREQGLATALVELAVYWLRERCAGTCLVLRAAYSNPAMKKSMAKLGPVARSIDEECFMLSVRLRQPTTIDAHVALVAVASGFALTVWLAPLLGASAHLARLQRATKKS